MNKASRRLKLFHMDAAAIGAFLLLGRSLASQPDAVCYPVFENDLPDDARVVNLFVREDPHTLVLVIWSGEFEEVPAGSTLPSGGVVDKVVERSVAAR